MESVTKPRPKQRNLVLQPRDIAVLRGLFESRVMTTEHICALYFDSHAEMAKKRLQRLTAAGLISKKHNVPFQVLTRHLTTAGLEELRRRRLTHTDLSEKLLKRRLDVSPLTLRHELAVLDVKVAFHTAAKRRGLELLEFCTWPALNELPRRSRDERAVRPDGFAIIRSAGPKGPQNFRFYVELDRSTESTRVLVRRAHRYQAASRTLAQLANRMPFRTLFVFISTQRRDAVGRIFLNARPPILTQAWLTTLSDVMTDPFAEVWVRPLDYRSMPAAPQRLLGRDTGQGSHLG